MKIKAIPADLQMIKFAMTKCELNWVDPPSNDLQKPIDLKEYDIEIEMEASDNSEDPSELFYQMEIVVNGSRNPLPGYQIRMAANALFEIQDWESKSDVTLYNFRVISPTSLMINTLRAAISDLTSYSVLGRYNLPAIDILKLIEGKEKQVKRKKSRK